MKKMSKYKPVRVANRGIASAISKQARPSFAISICVVSGDLISEDSAVLRVTASTKICKQHRYSNIVPISDVQ